MTTSSAAAKRQGWLELLQQSGPFLTVPVAEQTWPTGLPSVPTDVRARVRAAVAELLESSGRKRAELAEVLFGTALGWGEALVEGVDLPVSLAELVAEYRLVVRPDFAFFCETEEDDEELEEHDEEEDKGDPVPGGTETASPFKLLGMWVPWGQHPLVRRTEGGWAASPVERLAVLLRARKVPIGLVSDGRWWALVWAPRGKPVGTAVWDASLWSEEPETLAGFVALLSRQRFSGVGATERLPALLQRSVEAQEEVTDALGDQVRAAVEMLVERLDELDRQHGGSLLAGVDDDEMYAAVVTVMMRVLFLLFAEERRLLPSDDDRYDRNYSVGRLVEQLEQRASLNGEQTLEHRTGAWHRLLAVARALHQGVAHEDLRLPPYGGDLFDPDRYPWLEGREENSPPPVDDLTVLRMLEAVQYVHLQGERRRLTFRALDVEQIGYVYEGLLELEVRTATEPIIKLRKRGRKGLSFVGLTDALKASSDLEGWVASTYVGEKKANQSRLKAAAHWLAEPSSAAAESGFRTALGADTAKLDALIPLVRCNERGQPAITPTGGRFVAPSIRRAATGAHYTPRSLAEEIVRNALEPLVYRPGPLETLESKRWVLRPSTDLLALRVADIAMGSGAFLVAACRYLADRVVEAWDIEGDIEASHSVTEGSEQTADAEVAPVVLRARRLVAEHCLYGVDVNPLAVEMAKLSLWLVTMDRERPFGFLNDRLVCGDSLLGLTSLAQLESLHIDPSTARKRREGSWDFTGEWRNLLAAAADTRRRITATPVVTVRDVEHKARLLEEAEALTTPLSGVADAITGAGMMAASRPASEREQIFAPLEAAVWGRELDGFALQYQVEAMDAGLPKGKEPRRPLHWPLVFPEVFADTPNPGFDAIVGNPPFLGGKKISGTLGSDYLAWLSTWDGRGVKGSADLAARFLLRTDDLLASRGQLGFVTTNTLIEGDTLAVGLIQLEKRGWTVRRGTSPHPWPSSSANLSVIEVWVSRAPVTAEAVLDDEAVPHLAVDLQPYLHETGRPERLEENEGIAFQGSNVLGLGFTMEPERAKELISDDSRNGDVLFPYVIGADLNRRPDLSASRWIINFHDWSLQRAESYPGPVEQVRQLVKPQRDLLPDYKKRVRDAWWRYEHQAPTLYEKIRNLDYVLAISFVGNTLLPVRVRTGQVFAHVCGVFALEDLASLAVLSSSAHQAWVIRYTSTMRTDIRYAPSDVFLTFPRPAPAQDLEDLGSVLDKERRSVMLGRALGLTKLYNQVHDPGVSDQAIVRLREIHEEIDYAVAAAYGWEDLDLAVGHHPTKIGVRWTVSPQARFELLDRLLVENHRRAGTAPIDVGNDHQ